MTVLPDLPLGTILELIVCVFLGATIAYCAMLDRRLRAMRSGQDGLRDLVVELNNATQRAVSAIEALKQASAATGDDLGGRVTEARALADDLSLMIESGERIAEKIGRIAIAADRPAVAQPATGPRNGATPKPAGRDAALAARAANQLLEALKKAR